MESQMPERIADARCHKRIITISKELDFPNYLGTPYDGCLSLDIRLTVFLSAFWSHFGDRCCLIDKQDNKFVNIVCLDGYVYNQSNYLWLLLIVVAFVENDDSRHVHGELDYFEGLQYTLSSFHPWTELLSSLAGSESAYNQEHSLCNPYLNKNEVPPWFAVQMGSVAESVVAKVRLFFELCKEFERKVRKDVI